MVKIKIIFPLLHSVISINAVLDHNEKYQDRAKTLIQKMAAGIIKAI